jgi:threonine dehydrogenase-like Zn-dependent dehydrogenase
VRKDVPIPQQRESGGGGGQGAVFEALGYFASFIASTRSVRTVRTLVFRKIQSTSHLLSPEEIVAIHISFLMSLSRSSRSHFLLKILRNQKAQANPTHATQEKNN